MTEHDAPPPELDLSPRSTGPSSSRRTRNWVVVGVFVVILGVIVYQALTTARVFFYNVDEAVERREELGDDTFRLQGTVVEIADRDAAGGMRFTVSYNEIRAQVRHVGEEPTDLFELGIPVVAEGHWEGETFVSRQLLVKHSETYVEDNPDRVDYDTELEETGRAGAESGR